MCLILFSHKVNPVYPLIMAANRDEFYDRPTDRAAFWPDFPEVLAGRDLEKGGTWLGINSNGRIAAVTNYRGAGTVENPVKSRGLLVKNFICSDIPLQTCLEEYRRDADLYNAFNLVLGEPGRLYFLGSREDSYRELVPGVYGLSNGDLDSPWPKVRWGKQQLSRLDVEDVAGLHEQILSLLANTDTAIDEELPDTGIGLAMERKLSPVFIQSERYGTRASTVISVDRGKVINFSERSFDASGKVISDVHEIFTLREVS